MKRYIITFNDCTKYEVIKAQEMMTYGDHIYFYSNDVGIVTFYDRNKIRDVIMIERRMPRRRPQSVRICRSYLRLG